MEDATVSLLRDKCRELSIDPTPVFLVVSIRHQWLQLHSTPDGLRSYPISTSKKPPSCQADSLGTPWGLHRVNGRIGAGEPTGTVFRGRRSIGRTWNELEPAEQETNLITSRILRLEGLETGINRGPGVDSFSRYIYIHGTHHEDRIGSPASGGCVQLANLPMIDLFNRTPDGSLVLILDPAQG